MLNFVNVHIDSFTTCNVKQITENVYCISAATASLNVVHTYAGQPSPVWTANKVSIADGTLS